ncbi:AraC family transcriptional regulator [Enterococcus dongliensis]|uniref:AraC family transcriptional regulator n=1 Tax=Enterococcus dongliensis TaxID=2559925 RepID=A0AAW8TMB5_9ENTE|nr:AraC family transcriptional regulator [Enterococcus dongliensis]MDT2597325.1 AraC family transcriptional regulator [Enterococcus dongliensis]MDT2604396.1 AraC family transcriptional regulator [Enterococcus dongliensis]MDT2635194.1 AraC family transcriptional regulator [Enterococcus dongliensis]MDT2637802.1 AraC family transcriptional regulator [Enterococcus dongliensis]MDT2643278.1 AraC family transcriptional regulator [Enterococcus dongliensis]
MIQDLNRLMDYIEEHLTQEISLAEAAKTIGISEYHLKRTFSFIAGLSLIDYIKIRRLALANEELVRGESVTDIAFKYRYQSVEGFSRAFREWSGYLPSEVIKNRQQKSFPRRSFYIDVKGGVSMDFKIEEKDAFNLVGVSKRVPIQFEGVNNAIQELAQSITEKQKTEMHELGDLYPKKVINASYTFDEERMEEKGELTHFIGFATTQENQFADLTQLKIAKQTWAVFPNKGPFPQTLQDTWGKIYSEWLPSSDYELVQAPEISFTNFSDGLENCYSEIWLAVKKKN